MALTFHDLKKTKTSNGWVVTGKVDLDVSYPNGGYTFLPTDVGLTTLHSTEFSTVSDDYVVSGADTLPASGYLKVFDVSSGAVSVNSASAGTPVGTNSSSAVTTTKAAMALVFGPSMTGTTSGNTTTITGGAADVAENALAGGTITDGSIYARVISNSVLTASTGTIETQPALGPVIVFGSAWQLADTLSADGQAFTGLAMGTHTHTLSGGSGGGLAEVAAMTDLSGCVDIDIMFTGV